jgi:hypothetical protein
VDCATHICTAGTCRNPTCSDGLKNQNESDVDCGGVCPDCVDGRSCNGNGDCRSGYCQAGVCRNRPTCSGAPSTAGAQNYTVLIDLPNYCGGYVTYFANSFPEAKGCASAAGLSVPSQMCQYELLIQTNPNYWVTVAASSPAYALQCSKNTICSNCSPTVTNVYSCVLQ